MLLETPGPASSTPLPRPAPCAAVEGGLAGDRLVLTLAGDGLVLRAVHEAGETWLEVDGTVLRSRWSSRADDPVDAVGLTLTGTHVVALTRTGGAWTGRARADLLDLRPDAPVRDPAWLAGLAVGHEGAAASLVAGGFGQVGLRDVRLVTQADGSPLERDGLTWLCATSAGPGHFGTGHTSVWSLDRSTLEVEHRADLFFQRPSGPEVFGDHASHLVRDGDGWLVATSTWGDLDPAREGARVEVLLARSDADLLEGVHVLAASSLPLPTRGRAVGVWDPHLLRTGDGWLVGYVQATKFFRFHPVLAHGPSLDALALSAAAPDRRATEGTTLLPRPGGDPLVLAATAGTAGAGSGSSGSSWTPACARWGSSLRRTRRTSRGPRSCPTATAGCWSPSTARGTAAGCAATARTATWWCSGAPDQRRADPPRGEGAGSSGD